MSSDDHRRSRRQKITWGAVVGVALPLLVAIFPQFFGEDSSPTSGSGEATSSAAATSSRSATTRTQPSAAASTRSSARPSTAAGALATCALDTLPEQASIVVDTIRDGGPLAYPENDGTRFGNYEGNLPREARNFYREYTVDTPGLRHRGARRIVTGGGSPTDPEVWYYTDDHYESFCEIPDAEDDK